MLTHFLQFYLDKPPNNIPQIPLRLCRSSLDSRNREWGHLLYSPWGNKGKKKDPFTTGTGLKFLVDALGLCAGYCVLLDVVLVVVALVGVVDMLTGVVLVAVALVDVVDMLVIVALMSVVIHTDHTCHFTKQSNYN